MSTGNIIEQAGGNIITNITNEYNLYANKIKQYAAQKINWKGTDGGVVLGDNPKDPEEGKTLVKTAYFAKKVEKAVAIATEQDYTVEAGNTHTSIAKAVKGVNAKELKLAHPKLKPGENITLKVHGQSKELSLEKVASALVGAKLFIVVETFGLKDINLTIDVLGSNNITFVKADEVIKVLVGEEEKTSVNIKVGNYSTKTEYSNAASFINKAVAEVELKPKDANTLKEWGKKISESEEKAAFLHLRVKAETEKEVVYYNEDEIIKEPTKDKGIYLNKKDAWLKLFVCYCDRNITENELKDIVKEMRMSEKISSTILFNESNCTLNEVDKTYQRLTDELNKTFNTYNINTCIRKIHFLAQIYWEGDRFRTTLEYSSGEYLNPGVHADAKANGHLEEGDGPRYKGRGLMQLTWRNTQKEYLEHIINTNPGLVSNMTIDELLDRGDTYEEKYFYNEKSVINGKSVTTKKTKTYSVDSAALIASDLFFAVDSAGWFWETYKMYKKHSINYYADYGDLYIDFISKLVNGGGNGKSERKNYYEKLRDNVFQFKKNCINYDNIKTD